MNNILNFDDFINEHLNVEKPTEKKAVKLFNIKWNLNDVEPEAKAELEKTLPKKKGFTVDSDFNVAERVPVILKKKFGYDIVDFSFNEYRIVETLEDLLYLCLTSGEKRKDIFKVNGRLSLVGEDLANRLAVNIKKRKRLESEGTDEFKMPKLLDEIMLGICKIYDIDWEDTDLDEILKTVKDDIASRKRAVKKIKKVADMGDEDDEDEESYREVDDAEVPQDVKDADARSREEDEEIYFDEKTKRYYFADSDYYMVEDENGEFKVYNDGEYEGKYCGSIEALKSQDDPLGYVLSAI